MRLSLATPSFVAILILFMGVLLIGPRIPAERQSEFCVVNVDLPGPFGLSLNCDSPEFMRLAADPAALLDAENTRQSRPGLVLAAAALSLPLSLLKPIGAALPARASRSDIDQQRISEALSQYVPAFAAYVLLNAAFLVACFVVLRRIAHRAVGGRMYPEVGIVVLAAGSLFLSNDVTRFFMWSPHTQLLNVLLPVLAMSAVLWSWSGGLRSLPAAAGAGLATGVGLTAYPLSIILAPALLGPAALRAPWQPADENRRLLCNAFALLCGCVLPYLVWYLSVRFATGRFYSHEIASGQLVWIRQAYAQGLFELSKAFAGHIVYLLQSAAMQAVAAILMIVWVLGIAILSRRADASFRRVFARLLAACVAVSGLALLFYAGVGWLSPRLAYAAVPPWIVLSGAIAACLASQLDVRPRRILAAGMAAIALGNMIVVLAAAPAVIN